MLIQPNWRILTVGDGDLSFSLSLLNHVQPAHLVASVYDSEQALKNKYKDNAFDTLTARRIEVITEFDVTSRHSWQRLEGQQFDAVLFQFPLIPAFKDEASFKAQPLSVNTLNRRLLRLFVIFSQSIALDPLGAQLSVITSKDVKPYTEWDLESSLTLDLDIHYLGQTAFDIQEFPGYQVRNVDRDKHVKDTSGICYYWSLNKDNPIREALKLPPYLQDDHCSQCRAGPFHNDTDKQRHYLSKKHLTMQKHQRAWLEFISGKNANNT
ncbi:class I SAM-dependent methyltransferase (plasmid) [Pseudoalteromonas sp. T1lg65]|uniref:class I SAM-dependent methyltransferase n=1 Tax=Pseudoalteromonas sp. T1lg65 TaxID=2077101 RepID=UPI003F79E83A